MATPAAPLTIVNYEPNDPNASTDMFPPSFPGGRALPPETLAQLTPTEVDKGSFHAQALGVKSTWTKAWRELREFVRIVDTEEADWVCFFWYPSSNTCLVRCVNTDSAFREVWYKGTVGGRGLMKLELHLVVPSGRGGPQAVELHQKGWVLHPQWHYRDYMRLLGVLNDEPVPAVVQAEELFNLRIQTVVLTDGKVLVKYEVPQVKEATRTCIRNLGGGMTIYGPVGEKLFVQEAKGQQGGTITWWYRVGWDARDYELKRLMRNGKWKRDFELKPGPNPNPRAGKKRPFNEVGLTEEQQEAYEEEAEQSLEHDGARDEAIGEREYVTEAPIVPSDDEDDFNGPCDDY